MGTKIRPVYMLSTRDPPQTKGHIWLKLRAWKKIFHVYWGHKKVRVAILITHNIDFKIKTVIWGHYIMIKGTIQEEDIIIINIDVPNIG